MVDRNRYRRAWGVLYGFYEQVVDRAADAILDKEESIGSPYLGQGEEIAERHGHLLGLTTNVLGALRAVAEKPAVQRPPVTKVASISCPDAEVGDRLQRFFSEHPGVTPVSVQVVPRAETCLCVVVYSEPVQG
jgi:hypothetical protein